MPMPVINGRAGKQCFFHAFQNDFDSPCAIGVRVKKKAVYKQWLWRSINPGMMSFRSEDDE